MQLSAVHGMPSIEDYGTSGLPPCDPEASLADVENGNQWRVVPRRALPASMLG